MIYRTLGKTGRQLSAVGFGGIVVRDTEPAEAARLVAHAVEERGITYFDVAPSYGNAEERLGPALEPYRDRVFLACKTSKRDAAGAEADLRNSLKVLRTGAFDLYQFHGVSSLEDVERIFGSDGALAPVRAAQEAGLVRDIGFSAHSEEAALAMLERYPFASVMMPINWACWLKGGFGPRVAARVTELGIGLLALKTLAIRRWHEGEERTWPKCWYLPISDAEEALLPARFTLSRPVTAAVAPGHAELLWLLCDAVERFAPITADEEATLIARADDITPIFSSGG